MDIGVETLLYLFVTDSGMIPVDSEPLARAAQHPSLNTRFSHFWNTKDDA